MVEVQKIVEHSYVTGYYKRLHKHSLVLCLIYNIHTYIRTLSYQLFVTGFAKTSPNDIIFGTNFEFKTEVSKPC